MATPYRKTQRLREERIREAERKRQQAQHKAHQVLNYRRSYQ